MIPEESYTACIISYYMLLIHSYINKFLFKDIKIVSRVRFMIMKITMKKIMVAAIINKPTILYINF